MIKAHAIMRTKVLSVTKDTDIYEAIRLLSAHNVTGLPVVDRDHLLVGIVTEKDVLTLLYNIEDKPGRVEDYMTPNVIAFERDDDLTAIAESLRAHHFRRVPILEKGRLVGIVSRKDIIRHIRDQHVEAATPVGSGGQTHLSEGK